MKRLVHLVADYLLFAVGVVGAVIVSLPLLIGMGIGWTLDTLAYGEYFGQGKPTNK